MKLTEKQKRQVAVFFESPMKAAGARYESLSQEKAVDEYEGSGPYPEYLNGRGDVIIAHHHMKWTMVYTHEEDLGPYFLTLR